MTFFRNVCFLASICFVFTGSVAGQTQTGTVSGIGSLPSFDGNNGSLSGTLFDANSQRFANLEAIVDLSGPGYQGNFDGDLIIVDGIQTGGLSFENGLRVFGSWGWVEDRWQFDGGIFELVPDDRAKRIGDITFQAVSGTFFSFVFEGEWTID